MTRIIFFITCLAFMNANSQHANSQRRFGIIGGIDNPVFTEGILKAIDFQVGTGIQVGVFYEMDLNRTIHFRPRLMYSQQGDRAKEAVYYYSYSHGPEDYKLNYINIPLDIKFWNKVYVVLGPQVGFLVHQKAEGRFPGPAKSSFDFGANLGMGVSFKQTFLELGIYQGLTSVIETPYASSTQNYNNALARFSIGWRIF